MATTIRAAGFAFAALVQAFAAPSFAANVEAGRYDALMLAVTPDHQVEGYYLEELGEGVSRRCTFYLQGPVTDGKPAPITTWRKQAFAGTLAASDYGVVLTVAQGRDHPGCMSVMAPQITSGLELGRIESKPWIGLVSVSADKAYLQKSAGAKATKRPYIVKNDVVGVLAYKDGWARVEYVNADDRSFTGWIRQDQYSRLTPPKH